MKETRDFEKELDEAFDPLIKRGEDTEARLKQLEADIMVIANHLGFLRKKATGVISQ